MPEVFDSGQHLIVQDMAKVCVCMGEEGCLWMDMKPMTWTECRGCLLVRIPNVVGTGRPPEPNPELASRVQPTLRVRF